MEGRRDGAGEVGLGSGTFGYDPAADPWESHGGVGEAVLAPVVLGQACVAVLIDANSTFSEFPGRPDAAAELISFECVSHSMASSVSIFRTGSTSPSEHLFPLVRPSCGLRGKL